MTAPLRWFQFSLRGLLVFVTLAALSIAASAKYRDWRSHTAFRQACLDVARAHVAGLAPRKKKILPILQIAPLTEAETTPPR